MPNLQISKEESKLKISERINAGEELLTRTIYSDVDLEKAKTEYRIWSEYNSELLKNIFSDHSLSEEYDRFIGGAYQLSPPFDVLVQYYRKDVSNKVNRLKSILERLDLYPEPSSGDVEIDESNLEKENLSKKIFLVHGHDESAKQSVARLIEKIGLEVIILHEKPNKGRTIIQKFGDYSNVGFAVVLLTPDDLGAESKDSENLKPRARQNVILELGFFMGKLGLEKVCALHKEDIELPSDYDGVIYIELDDQEVWKYKLANELKAAGYDIDLNKIV